MTSENNLPALTDRSELASLIQQTKEELRFKCKKLDWDYEEFLNDPDNCDCEECEADILKERLSALQTAQDIFIKMLDERIELERDKDCKLDKDGTDCIPCYVVNTLEEIKSQLGEKT